MKIGIDARMFGSGFGLARYVRELILHLELNDNENEYVIFLQKNNWDVYTPARPQFQKVLADIPWYSVPEQVSLPRILRRAAVDLMHFPHWNVPLAYRGPFVATIHDLTMYRYPRTDASTHGPLVYWAKDQAHRLVVRQAVRRAKRLFVTSEFTKEDIHHTLGVSREKMLVTYQAPFCHGDQTEGQTTTLVEYGIHKPYVLYVGAAYPHKNLSTLLEAWQIFLRNYGDTYQLVLVGKHDWFYEKIKAAVRTIPQVVCTGFVPDAALSALYAQASLFVYPSLYEGFGLPPLEAMAKNVPVVASNRSCLPEILGEGALYIDPENSEQMADMIYRGLTDEAVRFDLRSQAKIELLRYSWDTLAATTVSEYRRVHNNQ